jgi:hypothetical protein
MEGYRALESGELRVSESDVLRSTEGFNAGDAFLSAVSSKLTASVFGAIGNSLINATSVLTVSGTGEKKGSIVLSGTASLQSDADVFLIASSSLGGVGSQEASGRAIRAATASLAGSSVLGVSGTRIKYGLSDIQGTGSLACASQRVRYGLYTGFNEEATRITQDNDVRVTEDGNVRITNPIAYNEAEGTLVAENIFTRFNATAYIKKEGIWRRVSPNAKYNGEWRSAQKIYKNITEKWKRVY